MPPQQEVSFRHGDDVLSGTLSLPAEARSIVVMIHGSGDADRDHRCPVLAIYGDRDRLTPPLKSADIFRRTLTRGGNHDVTVRVFAGAGHTIHIDGSSEFAPGYLDLMSTWIAERVR